MKKILSILLTFCLFLAVFGTAPITASAAAERMLLANDYGILNNYGSVNSLWASNLVYPEASTAQYMQSLESMKNIGFSDKTNIPYVAFMVEAPSDGVYTISPNYYVGGSGLLNDYRLTIGVNDKTFYQASGANEFKSYKPQIEVSLNEGVNIIRLLPFTAENAADFSQGRIYVNIYSLYIENTLSGIAPSDYLELFPALTSKYINNFLNIDTANGALGNVSIDNAKNSELKFESLQSCDLVEMPYFSYTVNAPYSGFYDISVEVYTGLLGEQGYLTVFVDDQRNTRGFIDTKAWYTTANISVYMSKGIHTLSVTSALGLETAYYRDWCDFRAITLGGGLTLFSDQLRPFNKKYTTLNAKDLHLQNYTVTDGIVKADFNTLPFNSSADSGVINNSAYVALCMRAPKAGNYSLKVTAGLQSTVDTAENLFTTANINGYNYKIPLKNSSEHTTVNIENVYLDSGINYAYFYSADSELSVDISTDYSSILIPAEIQSVVIPLYRMGDANSDNFVDLRDLLRLKKHLADNNVYCDLKASNLSGNSDESVSAADITALTKILLNVSDAALPNANELNCELLDSSLAEAIYTSYEAPDKPYVDVSDSLNVYDASKLNKDLGNIVYVNPQTKYQEIYGFGGAMADSSAYNLDIMSEENRKIAMNALFNRETGIGLNLLRQPCGVTDFAVEWYTYDDLAQGRTDYDLNNFSISRDMDYIIPAVKEAMLLNPDINVISAVWSPPLWMKTKYSWITTPANLDYSVSATESNTAMLKKNCYDVFARYCAKFIKAYEEQGIPIKSFVAQNELTGRHGIPSTFYYESDYSNLINNYIAPTFKNQGIDTALWSWDFNYFEGDIINFTNGIINNINGIAMHTYDGSADVVKRMHEKFPQLGIYITESSVVNGKGAISIGMSEINKLFRYGVSSIIRWCLVLNQYNGPSDSRNPHLFSNYRTTSAAPITYLSDKDELVFGTDYYLMGHYSKYIDRGAYMIDCTDLGDKNSKISNTAFLNPDGSVVLEFSNNTSDNQLFKFVIDNKVFEYTLEMKSVATIKLQYQ